MILDANLQINLKTAKESYYFFLQTFTERCFLTKTAVAALPVWENSHRYNIINKVCTLFDDYLMTIDDEDTLGGILHTTALQVVNRLVVPVDLLVSLHLVDGSGISHGACLAESTHRIDGTDGVDYLSIGTTSAGSLSDGVRSCLGDAQQLVISEDSIAGSTLYGSPCDGAVLQRSIRRSIELSSGSSRSP